MPRVRVVPFVTAFAFSWIVSAASAQPAAAAPALPAVPWEWFRVDVTTGALTSLESKMAQKEKRGRFLYCYLDGASSPVTFRQGEPLAFAYRRDGSPSDIERVRKGQLRTPDQILHDVNTYHLEFLSVSDLGRRYGTGKFVPMTGEPYGEVVSGVNPKKQKEIGQAFLFKPSRPLAPGEYVLLFGSLLVAPSYTEPYCNYTAVSAFRIVEGPATAPSTVPPSTRSEVDIEQERKAAEQGEMEAQFKLGYAYLTGSGVRQDYAQADEWFRKAADRSPGALYYLAVMSRDGLGVPQDHAKAAQLFRGAADRGSPNAQAELGNLYVTGKGLLQDYVEGHKWMNLACTGFSGDAQKQCVADRDRLAALMTSAQIAEAQKLAREWSETPTPGRR
jgi:TPR repeat protein